MKEKRKQYLTLLEIMVVISLITIILGVLGYNMKNVLNKGKKFRTEQAIERLHSIFDLNLAEGKSATALVTNSQKYIEESGLARDPESLLKDGWGDKLIISINRDGEISIKSKNLK